MAWNALRFGRAIGLVVGIAVLAGGSSRSDAAESSRSVVAADNRLGFELYRQLAGKAGNLVLSPHSIATAMAMALAGARGPTEKELAGALHIDMPPVELADIHQELAQALNAAAATGGPSVLIADALQIKRQGNGVASAFKQFLADRYGAATFEGTDVTPLNEWVRQRTNGRIARILTKLDPRSVCVLVNAIYFKGEWAHPFSRPATHPDPFEMAAGKPVQVAMMHQRAVYQTLRTPTYNAIRLPYANGALGMVIVVPVRPGGLKEFEGKLDDKAVAALLDELANAPEKMVALTMPSFRVELNANLVPLLKTLGIRLAFDADRADFSGMTGTAEDDRRIHISQIQHRSFAEVNEDGTEAAATTAVEFATRSAMSAPEEFKIDRPFLFLIADGNSGAILFVGRVVDPRSAGNTD